MILYLKVIEDQERMSGRMGFDVVNKGFSDYVHRTSGGRALVETSDNLDTALSLALSTALGWTIRTALLL